MARVGTLIAAALLLAALLPAAAFAHEGREVGEYRLIVGFLNEPALIDEPNSVYLRVMKEGPAEGGHDEQGSQREGESQEVQHEDEEGAQHEETPTPVEGLADTVKVKVSSGSSSREFALSPQFGQPGAYIANFIPTAAGTYIFQFTGTIEGTPIDETFESGPGRFGDVEEKAQLDFPEVRLSPQEVQGQLQSAGQATTFGLIGIALGAIGTLLGLGAIFVRRR